MKKVSVIIPVYNVEKYLMQCLESVLNQTLEDIEIICVNDGSKDSSKMILEQYQKQDSRIVVINKENGGYGSACNEGLKRAKGEFISIIEADDFIDSNMFKKMYELAKENKADIIKSSYYEYKDTNNKKGDIKKINWDEQYNMPDRVFKLIEHPQFLYFHPSIWSCLYRREFLNKQNIKFSEPKGAGWADNPFQVQTLILADRIIYTNEAYYYYRLTNTESSSTTVNINNPFDRTKEIHNFLRVKKITDENLLAHLYKREFSYINIVLSCISDELVEYAYKKTKEMLNDMDSNIIYKNEYINDYERWLFESNKTIEDFKRTMFEIKKTSNTQAVNSYIE